MQSRAFNTVLVDSLNKKITKSSVNKKKLKDEINFYLALPKSLNSFFPELLNYSSDYSMYTMEYYPSNNLADLILNSGVSLNDGTDILTRLLVIADQIHSIKPEPNLELSISSFYIKKTIERLGLMQNNSGFSELARTSCLSINGIIYHNFNTLKSDFIDLIEDYSKDCSLTGMHGDFCFSNILYSPNGQIIKLIDPRGSFGLSGIYGDKHYDFAKIMHCLHGKYDYLVNDVFYLEETEPLTYKFDMPRNLLLNGLHEFYVDTLIKKGLNLDFIYLIEASIFLSMVPLHYENKMRQKALYLNGLIILNQVLNGHYHN